MERAFRVYGHPLTTVTAFNCIGKILTALGNYFPVLVSNLLKARNKWARMPRVLVIEWGDTWTPGTFFKVVVQTVLLSVSEMLVLTPHIGRTLGVFQHRMVFWMKGKQLWRIPYGRGEYPILGESIPGEGLEEVEEYITRR